ncbi:unnamed protein product [Adineta ricciae]|uniref:PiggyBac transposable element-derived protein domain-containing protein n=1 Tax=Adineta ricciae TaxID=249248 RepID=A0A814WTH6_ADIRI|nr:unnamed protein product [Adineta ricciae]
MIAVRQPGTKDILYDEQSEVESDSTNEDQSQTSEDSGSDSGNFIICTGSVVMRLMQPCLLKGHNLPVDSWFPSPALSEELHANSIGVCGTVRQNRFGMPRLTDQLEKSDCDYRHTDILLAIKLFNKREVTILSTIHEALLAN